MSPRVSPKLIPSVPGRRSLARPNLLPPNLAARLLLRFHLASATRAWFLFALGLTLVACSDSTEPDPQEPDEVSADLVPLDEGNRWTFAETIERSGTVGLGENPQHRSSWLASPPAQLSFQGTLTREVQGTRVLQGLEYKQLIETGGAQPDSSFYSFSDERLSMFDPEADHVFELSPGPDLIGWALERSFPWVIADNASQDRSPRTVAFLDTTVTVDGVNVDQAVDVQVRFVGPEEIETPAGTWPAAKRFQIESSEQIEIGFVASWEATTQFDFWLVDSLGWVREETFRTLSVDGKTSTQRRVRELISFEPGAGPG